MKKLLLASAALIATVVSVPAMAADIPVKARYKAPPPVYVYSWTGCYIGGHAGGLWVTKDWTDSDPRNLSGNIGLPDGGHSASGFLGGVQAGCDYQFAGGFVIGIAGDYAWTNAEGSHPSVLYPGFTYHTKVKSLASVTGRIGYAWDRVLGYVKGGGAWESDDHSFDGFGFLGTASQTRSGWTVGLGGEYAFTNFVSGFAEYNYYNFGTRNVLFNDNAPQDAFHYTYGIKETKSVFKVGLNIRWGGSAVVAKY